MKTLVFLILFGFTSQSLLNLCTNPPPISSFDAQKFSGIWITSSYFGAERESMGKCNRVLFYLSSDMLFINEQIKYINETNNIEILNDQYRLDLNGFGHFSNIFKKNPITELENILGFKSSPLTLRVISTDYKNYAFYYYCNQLNPLISHDELFVLTRFSNKTQLTEKIIASEMKRFGFQSKPLIEIEQNSCEKIIFELVG